jgi:superfamily II DNA/RNA helicase
MELIDCGTSGTTRDVPTVSWDSLELPDGWTKSLRLLSGSDGPRPVQLEAFSRLRLLENRRNLLVSAPTNAGKSLVGLGLLLDAVRNGGRAVLLEPLRALAREKADEIAAHRKVLAAALGIDLQIKLTTGDYRLDDEYFSAPPPQTSHLIVATPERFDAILRNQSFQGWIDSVTAVCIDEAHLIGDPRRGATIEYVLTSLLCRSRPPRLALLSASLGQTDRVQNWLSPCDVLRVSERCPPLRKFVAALDDRDDPESILTALVAEALKTSDASVLVFVYQTASTVALCRVLNDRLSGLLGPKGAMPYHAQMSSDHRQITRNAIDQGNSRCVVATTALGLGVNLPATHVIVRDVTFPGFGQLPITDILQMAGRAGRGHRPGTATVLLRNSDSWSAAELAKLLRDEPLPEMVSSFDRPGSGVAGSKQSSAIPSLATLIALQLARHESTGVTHDNLTRFFLSSLGGQKIAGLIDQGLRWLTDPSRLIAFRNDAGGYQLTTLGIRAVSSTLPLEIAAGVGQLIRDLLQADSDDRWLSQWTPLDHLLLLECLSTRFTSLRRFNKSLPDQVHSWMESHPSDTPVIYREWINGDERTSKADQFLGSLGIVQSTEDSWKTSILATLRVIILKERGQGVSVNDLERRWSITNLTGVEEQWRDQQLWLIAGLRNLLETRCFYYCLRENCQAADARVERIDEILRNMRLQLSGLQEELKFCSPLGGILKSIRRSQESRIGPGTMRRLEAAGITSFTALAVLSVNQIVQLGIRRNAAESIYSYVRRRLQ